LNFESREKRFELSEISQTFQDAVKLTQALGIRYLWIDSICIIQDSKEDWERESSNMMAVYESAWLNIAAAGSPNEDGRLFMPRNQDLTRPCRLPPSFSCLNDSESGNILGDSYAFLDPSFSAQSVFDGFLAQRGWILQERVLSPRSVYFGRNEVYWECSQLMASESVPWGFSNDQGVFSRKFNATNGAPRAEGSLRKGPARYYPINDTLKTGQRDHILWMSAPLKNKPVQSRSLAVYDFWCMLVEDYSKKNLTVKTDKLLAIHGLAQALHRTRLTGSPFAESYYYGLWLDDFAHGLMWVPTTETSYDLACAPSFSWASCSGSVEFISSFIANSADMSEEQPSLRYGGSTADWECVLSTRTITPVFQLIEIRTVLYMDMRITMKERNSKYTFIFDNFRYNSVLANQTLLSDNSIVTLMPVMRSENGSELGLLVFPCNIPFPAEWWGDAPGMVNFIDGPVSSVFRRFGLYHKIGGNSGRKSVHPSDIQKGNLERDMILI
jgi:hypothetical protein